MMLALTCALCAASPDPAHGGHDGVTLLDVGLEVRESARPSPAAPTRLALDGMPDQGSGDGDQASHMGPMWILVGATMIVMMVGMGVYFMRHSGPGHALATGAVTSPAHLALPVSVARGGGG